MADLNELNNQLTDLKKQVAGLTSSIKTEQNQIPIEKSTGNTAGVLMTTNEISGQLKALQADKDKIKDLQDQISDAEKISSTPLDPSSDPPITPTTLDPTLTPPTTPSVVINNVPNAPPAPSVMYSCNNYTCSVDSAGQYSSLDDCQKDCTAVYQCDRPKLGNPTCTQTHTLESQYKSAKTKFDTLMKQHNNLTKISETETNGGNLTVSHNSKLQAQEILGKADVYKKSMLDLEDQLKKGHNSKIFNKLSECQDNCKPLYKCDSNTNECIISADGSYNSLTECETNCKPRFACDDNNWTIRMDPRGEYRSPAEASYHCKPPLIVPKQNLTQKEIDKQKTMSLNIDGDLHSGKFRLKSTWMHLFVWSAIAILFIGLVFYYMSNNTDNALMTVVAIVIAIILIYIIAMWVYNHFIRNGGVKFGAQTY